MEIIEKVSLKAEKAREIILCSKINFCIIGIITVVLGCILNSSAFFYIGLGIIIIELLSVNNVVEDVVAILLLILLISAVNVGILKFNFMPQAYALLQSNDNVIYWFVEGHFHAIRLLIAYPSYIISVYFNVPLDLSYSYYCSIIFSMIYVFLASNINFYFRKKENLLHCYLAVVFFILVLALIMNGRICFAFLGFSMLIFEMGNIYFIKTPRKWIRRYINVIIGVILSTVSSGTMVVCVSFTILMFFARVIKFKVVQKSSLRFIFLCALGLPFIVKGVEYVWIMIDKNIVFFGGGFSGIINMLQHGVGRIFGAPSGLMVIWLVVTGVIVLIINIIVLISLRNNEYFPLFLGINIAFYGMFVGFSTGSLMLIPLAILFIFILNLFLEMYRGYEREKYNRVN